MPMSIFTRHKRVVSITIEENAIRYVSLKSAEPLVIDVAEEVPIPPQTVVDGKIVDSEALVAVLDEAVKKWKIAKHEAYFLVPDEHVMIRKVPYPDDLLIDELTGYFFIEIGSSIYLPFTDPVFDVVPYTPNAESNEAVLIASEEKILDDYEHVLEEAKLRPIVADIAPLALYRLAYTAHQFTGDEHIMIADLHEGKLTVSIFHAHYPLFMRPVDVEQTADMSIIMAAQKVEGQLPVSSITAELEKLTNFYRYNLWHGAAAISHIFVNGDYDQMANLLDSIRETLGVDAELLLKQPAELATGEVLPAAFNRTIGLALKKEVQ